MVWGRVLGGMWFGALMEVPLCEIGGRVLGGMQFLGAGGCELDGRVLGGIQLGLLVEVPGGCCFASLTARCQGACSLGCWCSRGTWWCWCWRRCCSGVLFEVLVKG